MFEERLLDTKMNTCYLTTLQKSLQAESEYLIFRHTDALKAGAGTDGKGDAWPDMTKVFHRNEVLVQSIEALLPLGESLGASLTDEEYRAHALAQMQYDELKNLCVQATSGFQDDDIQKDAVRRRVNDLRVSFVREKIEPLHDEVTEIAKRLGLASGNEAVPLIIQRLKLYKEINETSIEELEAKAAELESVGNKAFADHLRGLQRRHNENADGLETFIAQLEGL